jgi:alpha-1,6-mannosyltransferase
MKGGKLLFWLNVAFFLSLLLLIAYGFDRTEFFWNLMLYSGLFLSYLMGWALIKKQNIELRSIIICAILIRLSLIGVIPNWSEDYVRFLWDGELLRQHENPYLLTPEEWITGSDQDQFLEELYPALNSKSYYSVYPPSNQAVFFLGAWLGAQQTRYGILVIRLVILAFEGLAICLLLAIFRQFKLPLNKVWLYAFNPLIVLEITLNLHFEGIMLACMLGGILALTRVYPVRTGIWMGLATAVKLNPLMLFPSLLAYFPKKHYFLLLGSAGLVILMGFAPLLLGDAYHNLWQSIQLYQGKFEFNGSVYYLLRAMGYWVQGYNLIGTLSPMLSMASLGLILWISFAKVRQRDMADLLHAWILIYLVYFLLNTVIHPWYILPALTISLFTRKISFLVWSYCIFFSYHAYSEENFQEQSLWLFLEYLGLTLALIWDYAPGVRQKFIEPKMI